MPRRKPSGFSLVAFCRYCIIEAVFLLTSKTAFAAYQRQKGYRCNPSRTVKNVHPCTFLTACFALRQNIAAVWNHGHPCPFGKGIVVALLNMSLFGTSGIRDKNLHDRRVYVRTAIFCEICIRACQENCVNGYVRISRLEPVCQIVWQIDLPLMPNF